MDDPMQDTVQADIRRLLKTFGVKADETIRRYLEDHPGSRPLEVRITLEFTSEVSHPLGFSVEGAIRRQPES